ncbi:hypothetical protein ACLOJK_035622 [Asimina triloba]
MASVECVGLGMHEKITAQRQLGIDSTASAERSQGLGSALPRLVGQTLVTGEGIGLGAASWYGVTGKRLMMDTGDSIVKTELLRCRTLASLMEGFYWCGLSLAVAT